MWLWDRGSNVCAAVNASTLVFSTHLERRKVKMMMLMKARSLCVCVCVCVCLEGFICSVRLYRWGLQGSRGLELITGLIYPANKWNSFLTHYGLGHIFTLLLPVTLTHTHTQACIRTDPGAAQREKNVLFLSKWHIYTLSCESHIRHSISRSEHFWEALKWNAITAYSMLGKHSSVRSRFLYLSLSLSLDQYVVIIKCSKSVILL